MKIVFHKSKLANSELPYITEPQKMWSAIDDNGTTIATGIWYTDKFCELSFAGEIGNTESPWFKTRTELSKWIEQMVCNKMG